MHAYRIRPTSAYCPRVQTCSSIEVRLAAAYMVNVYQVLAAELGQPSPSVLDAQLAQDHIAHVSICFLMLIFNSKILNRNSLLFPLYTHSQTFIGLDYARIRLLTHCRQERNLHQQTLLAQFWNWLEQQVEVHAALHEVVYLLSVATSRQL